MSYHHNLDLTASTSCTVPPGDDISCLLNTMILYNSQLLFTITGYTAAIVTIVSSREVQMYLSGQRHHEMGMPLFDECHKFLLYEDKKT